MKTLLTAFAFAMTLILSIEPVKAEDLKFKPVQIKPIEVTGLSKWKGKFLTVYYAAHTVNDSLINTDANRIHIAVVRAAQESLTIDSDTLLLPSQILYKTSTNPALLPANIYPHYTAIVFVIHDKPNFSWQNEKEGLLSSRIPLGLKETENHEKIATSLIHRDSIRSQNAEYKPEDPIIGDTTLKVNLSNVQRISEIKP